MSAVHIYHNPDCGTSRNTLALLQHSGIALEIVEYLKDPPSRDEIRTLAKAMGYGVRDLIREKGTPFAELGLSDPAVGDDQLLDAIAAHPILLNRPIVVSDDRAALCRPSDIVLDLVANSPPSDLRKEDGLPFLRDRVVTDMTELRAALDLEGLPSDDVEEPGRRFYRYETLDGTFVGFAGLECYGRDALVRSLVVAKEMRGGGLGRTILQLLLTRAFNGGARQAWLLTTSAAPFFEKAGFKIVGREQAPGAIRTSRQAASLCPSDAPLLTRRITL